MDPVSILGVGMVTGLGLNAPSTCAAMRCGISALSETAFRFGGEPVCGGAVRFPEAFRGREKLLRMAVPAIEECLEPARRIPRREIPLLLCLAEPDRPARLPGLDASLLEECRQRLGGDFHPDSQVFHGGRTAGVRALQEARRRIAEGRPGCVVAGVDSLLRRATLAGYHESNRLLTDENLDGFLPGEAGAAVLVGPWRRDDPPDLACLGLGFGEEPSPRGSGEPLRAEGMVAAIRAALADSGVGYDAVHYRISDVSGEQYGFKELALSLGRTLRQRKEFFDLWHPADSIGECGSAVVPIVLGMASFAARKGYAPGPGVLAQFSSDGRERAALVLRSRNGGAV